ncbi:flagellar filament capping protein FliD [Massilia endophytica]|uniref:flagellar filament capping protein FliD n=1 Tax=Massilia endophytica TaxID=2899220 RepID=UPI001E2E41C5|nr:flagellar filament capping protein FliD [Massilia endophytica]UGQ48965.1 flagellar filament capping protein FliD [Massilia endophytica]
MATSSVPTYDPKTTATQLATLLVQDRQAQITAQTQLANATNKALTDLNSALSTFQSAMSAMTSRKSVVANTAALSGDAGTATADATAVAGTYNFYVEQLATAGQVAYNGMGDATAAGAGNMTIYLANGDSFVVDLDSADKDGDTLLSPKEIAAAINTAADNKSMITASTMTINGTTSLVLSSVESGTDKAFASIDLSNLSGELQGALDPSAQQQLVAPQDAIMWVGAQGTGTQITQGSNTFATVDGVKMTFTKAGVDTVLTVANDKSGTAANVQGFVDAWNKMVGVIKTITDHGDPAANKAAAVFSGDAGINALLGRMQTLLRKTIGTQSLVTFGITAQRDGTLALNSSRLEKAMATSPGGLDTLFGNNSLSSPSGVLGDLDGLIKTWTNSVDGQIGVRKDGNERVQKTLSQRQERLNFQYDTAYARYLDQFTRLQTLQNQMNSNTSIFDALFSKDK